MASDRAPALVLTGERRKRQFLVRIHGQSIWLTATLFSTLCELVIGHQRTTSGFVPIARQTIYRLRKAIGHAVSDYTFDNLIESGADQEYRLCIGVDDVAVGSAFAELRDKHLLAAADMELLVQSCQDVRPDYDRSVTGL